ncbi:MAG: hypothetical protein AB1798_19215 [Spirochaetota bacterium]
MKEPRKRLDCGIAMLHFELGRHRVELNWFDGGARAACSCALQSGNRVKKPGVKPPVI